VDLGQADRDRRLDVHRSRSSARPCGVAEYRAEDVSKTRALAEEVLHVVGRDRPVLDVGPARLRPETAAWAPPPAVRLHAGLRRRPPVGTELVVELPVLGVGEHVMSLRDLLES